MKIKLVAIVIALFTIPLMAAPSSQNASATFGWNYDFVGNPQCTGFNLYYGTSSTSIPGWDGTNVTCRCYQFVLATGSTNTTVTVTGLTRGLTYYFSVTPTGAAVEGDYSNEDRWAVPAKPGKATNLIILQVN